MMFSSKTTSEQKKILLKASTRKAIQRVEKDSASLIVHRDSGSVRTSYTDNMSKLSAVFAFDMELFTSKIYERAFRASFKDFLRQRRERPAQPTDLQESRASLDPRLMPQAKIILLGEIFQPNGLGFLLTQAPNRSNASFQVNSHKAITNFVQ